MRALAAFQEALRNERTAPSVVISKARAAQAEIEETAEQYRREWEARHAS